MTFSLRRRAVIAVVISLVVTVAALAAALTAATTARGRARELSDRLLPAAAAAGALPDAFSAEQSSLGLYVTNGGAAALAQFRQTRSQLSAQQARVAMLARGYPLIATVLSSAGSANRTWLDRVADPQLAAAARGDFAAARALQDDTGQTRPAALAVRTAMAALQAQVTRAQAQVVSQLISLQYVLVGSLVAVCVMVGVIAAGGMLVLRRWLLAPFLAVRQAADKIAAGNYGTEVPAVGPAELADLGRSTEQMRIRLVAALADAEAGERKFRKLFDSTPDATLAIAEDKTIMTVNAQAAMMFGYGTDELVGRPAATVLADSGALDNDMSTLAATLRTAWETTALDSGGREFPVELTLTVIDSGKRGRVGLVSLRDISERLAAQAEADQMRAAALHEQYERRLHQSQRLESLGQLVGGVAHDFNNMLNVIRGHADFLAEQLVGLATDDPRSSMRSDVEKVRDVTQRAATLTRQLLTFARQDEIHPQVLDVNSVVSGIDHLLRRTIGEHIELVTTLGPGLWPVMADSGQLDQVLVNLVVNASDAMPRGGKITIDTANVTVDETRAAPRPGLQQGRYVQIRVSDTGMGMDPEVAARAFEPFFTTKAPGKGTGLGLATVHGIITRAGGHAQIYTEPGMGTTITALLPAAGQSAGEGQAPATTPPEVLATNRGRGETILLVEDEEILADIVYRLLVRNGYRVCIATAPGDALHHARDLSQPIDLLLTDAVMPKMLGNEVAMRVRAVRPGLPVLFMSGYAQPVLDSQGALDPEKPFSEATLLIRVHRALHGEPGTARNAAPQPVVQHG